MTTALQDLDLLLTDHHVHSTWSDDAVSAPAENLVAARDTGLASIRMVDHVRTTTTWVPGFLAEVAALPRVEGLEVLTGVEAKMLDASGRLDLPEDLVVGPGGVDRILIADHQFPGPDGPWSPRRTLEEIEGGLPAQDALSILVEATVRAMQRAGRAQLAHLFSLLPKIGLHESELLDEHVAAIADAAVRTGTTVEVNEKWRCPGPRVVLALAAAGVTLVGSTDSHEAATVGRFSWVADAASATRLVGAR
ncbi:histidinol-phosphatase [Blastococcus sp. MG754426]|uniref:histidinol-phosphatase n=1 Tax=unclassified Blastococcus TaxID=2619396 RepID=UPI001EF05489|nr:MULTISPECIES: histidinol-phosphatase [unclassified Blastococcus]MCF6508684.1 histidinol-phosphatase [Blastococcus sp. MG754426]MCF6513287.1 histidinol-phosphatase [Blastococcus sp. MG754427]MCF6736747.1 histidinol-phosphatase [Blastococcus sp. KM273129]